MQKLDSPDKQASATPETLTELHDDLCRRAQSCWDLASEQASARDEERLSAKGDGYEHSAELVKAMIDRLAKVPS